MKTQAAVLYKGAIAHYYIETESNGTCKARLDCYHGKSDEPPPAYLQFRKEGRRCTGNSEERELMDELYYAVKLKKEERMTLPWR